MIDRALTRAVYVGVDPAATTGLIAVSVDADEPQNTYRWRYVDAAVIKKTDKAGLTKMENKLALYDRARHFIDTAGARYAVLERPSDNVPRGWGGKGQNKTGVQSTEVGFTIGESVGILAAAAYALHCRVITYPATSSRGRKGKKPRVGWMPMVQTGRLVHVQKREITLAWLAGRVRELAQHPINGMIDNTEDFARTLNNENVLMAFGVLQFHLLDAPATARPEPFPTPISVDDDK